MVVPDSVSERFATCYSGIIEFILAMTEKELKDDRLFREALDLIIRLQNDPTDPIAHELVRRWRARGADHEAVWVEVAEIHGMAGKVLEKRRKAEPAKGTISRRNVIIGGAIITAGALFGPDLVLRIQADHITATAELRRIPLSDGTIITLGPDSAIRTELTPDRRHAELLAGMAFFEVASDAARPFRASAGSLTAVALGTAFELSNNAGYVTVAVNQGLVETNMSASPPATVETLSAGDRLTLNEDTLDMERGPRDPVQIAAWRDGTIVAERETVASVVARIARWQPGRVVIADPGIGARRISGVFNLTHSIAALEAVVQPHGGRVRQISPWLTIISPI